MATPILTLPSSSSESDVEQALVYPMLIHGTFLGIPQDAIKTKASLAIAIIDKGNHKRRYHPDYLVYSDAIPVMVVEAKSPLESVHEGFREGQLYAHEVNKGYPEHVNPAQYIISCNGNELAYGRWDSNDPTIVHVRDLLPSSDVLALIKSDCGWDFLQIHSAEIVRKLYPNDVFFPYEFLGENRVRLTKIANNAFSEELSPLLQRYFESENPHFEREIIEKAYVSSDETTRYERLFETFLRDRVAPLDDRRAEVLAPLKGKEDKLTGKLQDAKRLKELPGYLQLIIGAVGAGKSTFLKRYFDFLIPVELKRKTVFVYFNFNHAPDDLSELNTWLCDTFVEDIRSNHRDRLNMEDTAQLKAVFNVEIKNKEGAYRLLREAGGGEFEKRLAADLIGWLDDKQGYARALARHLGGDKSLNLVFAFDNVDRRDRESQLKIFQTAQWFKNLTRSFCIICLRDTTFETYKSEPPLDTFVKSSNFYIQPPRFVDMVRRRLDLAIMSLISKSQEVLEFDIEGLGRIRYPKTNLGEYLNGIYVDLFRRKRKITMILEGLAGRSARRALEMFSAILKSGHLDTRQFTTAMLTGGNSRIQESQLIKALMRTDYLYFFEDHGFIHNVYDFPADAKLKNHLLKFEVLEFLIENRKRPGDARVEGFFSVGFILEKFQKMGFPPGDVLSTLKVLLLQNLVIADHMRATDLANGDLVRVHASGFIHTRILAARVDYLAACALATPIFDRNLAEGIGRAWHIGHAHTDVRHRTKNEVGTLFLNYLERHAEALLASHPESRSLFIGASSMLLRGREALGFASKAFAEPDADSEPMMRTFDRLFADYDRT